MYSHTHTHVKTVDEEHLVYFIMARYQARYLLAQCKTFCIHFKILFKIY